MPTIGADIRRDLTRTTLAIICILGLIGLSLWVLRPFLAAAVWATMIVVATWPLLISLQERLGIRRAPAVAVMTLGMLLVTSWTQFAASSPAAIASKVTPYAADTGKWVLGQVGGLGGMLLQFLLVVLIAAILYSSGEVGARFMRRFGRRLAGERGENSIILAGQAIRGVALGVGVTAIVQTVLGGIGLAIVGVPFASLLSAVMLMLCIAQIGPMLVLLPAVGWMYWTGDNGWATFLLVWSLVVGTLDNFLRPMLIKRGADLPLLLIFSGVIGGMLGFGLIGIFVGPVVLAVTYTLMLAWIEDELGKDNEADSDFLESDHAKPAAR